MNIHEFSTEKKNCFCFRFSSHHLRQVRRGVRFLKLTNVLKKEKKILKNDKLSDRHIITEIDNSQLNMVMQTTILTVSMSNCRHRQDIVIQIWTIVTYQFFFFAWSMGDLETELE